MEHGSQKGSYFGWVLFVKAVGVSSKLNSKWFNQTQLLMCRFLLDLILILYVELKRGLSGPSCTVKSSDISIFFKLNSFSLQSCDIARTHSVTIGFRELSAFLFYS